MVGADESTELLRQSWLPQYQHKIILYRVSTTYYSDNPSSNNAKSIDFFLLNVEQNNKRCRVGRVFFSIRHSCVLDIVSLRQVSIKI